MWIPLLPLGLVLIVVDNERFESPAPWMVHFRALSYRQRQAEFESQAKTESFGICFLRSPRPKSRFKFSTARILVPCKQGLSTCCSLLPGKFKGSLLNRTPTLSTKDLNDSPLGSFVTSIPNMLRAVGQCRSLSCMQSVGLTAV